MNATENLRNEHTEIKAMLKIFEGLCRRIDSGREVNVMHLDLLIDFFEKFAERHHVQKEEGLLFPALERAGVQREGGPIGIMLGEHAAGRSLIRKLRLLSYNYKVGDERAVEKISHDARTFISLITVHIDREEDLLLPAAETRLNPVQLDELARKFDEFDSRDGMPEYDKLLGAMKKYYMPKNCLTWM